MSDELNITPPEVDPMALPENHFEQDEMDAEDNFQAQYNQNPIGQSPGISEQEPPADAPTLDADGNPIETPPAEGTDEPFKFDDALAESEKAELEELNAKLGTDYKDLKDLKAAYKTEDSSAELKEIEEDRTYINYFKSVLDTKQYNDRRIVFEDKRMEEQDKGRDITDQSVLDEIEAEISLLESSGSLPYAAKSIRQTVQQALRQREEKVSAFDAKQEASKQQTEAQKKEAIQESISEVFKSGSFLGITPTKEDMIDIYKDISNNKHIEHLKSNPKDAVQFALFKRYQSVIEKNLGKPSYKAGVKDTLDNIGLSGSNKPATGLNDQGSDEGEKSYFDQFVQ